MLSYNYDSVRIVVSSLLRVEGLLAQHGFVLYAFFIPSSYLHNLSHFCHLFPCSFAYSLHCDQRLARDSISEAETKRLFSPSLSVAISDLPTEKD